MKKKQIICMLVFFAFLIFLTLASAAMASATIINCDADATVKSGTPSTNYGSQSQLNVGKESSSNEFYTFVKCPTTTAGLPYGKVIQSAKCRQNYYGNLYTMPPIINVFLYTVSNSWSESTITWNNKPSFPGSSDSYRQFTNGNPPSGYYDFDCTNGFRTAYNSQQQYSYGLGYYNNGNENGYLNMYSREASYPPQIDITWTDPTCSDGTPYGQCSPTKPLYCNNGVLENRCTTCGCNSPLVCDAGTNSCVTCINGQTQSCPLQQGVCAGSYQTCTGNNWPGCSASNYDPYYETVETLCDSKDNDCDGQVDESLSRSCGTGNCIGTQSCSLGNWGYCSTSNNDCGTCCKCSSQGSPTYDPTQNNDCSPTSCSGFQNGCGQGGCSLNIFGTYPSEVPNTCQLLFACTSNQCTASCQNDTDSDGYSGYCGDCNDNDPSMHQDAEELCDNKDNDCDQTIDEDLSGTASCGFCGTMQVSCSNGVWNNGTCNNPGVCFPGSTQECSVGDETGIQQCIATCTWGSCVITTKPAKIISPAVTTANLNTTFNVVFNLSSTEPVRGYDLQIDFDNTILNATAGALGDYLKKDGGSALEIITIRNNEGKIIIAGSRYSPANGITGNGTMGIVTFKALKEGTTILVVNNSIISSNEMTPIEYSYNTGQINIIIQQAVCGDTNNDGNVNLLDILYLINYIYKNGPAPVCSPMATCSDVNQDGKINLLDILYLINYIYKNGPAPTCLSVTEKNTKSLLKEAVSIQETQSSSYTEAINYLREAQAYSSKKGTISNSFGAAS